jgi:hypothetical protein
MSRMFGTVENMVPSLRNTIHANIEPPWKPKILNQYKLKKWIYKGEKSK